MKKLILLASIACAIFATNTVVAQEKTTKKAQKKENLAAKKAIKGKDRKADKKMIKADKKENKDK